MRFVPFRGRGGVVRSPARAVLAVMLALGGLVGGLQAATSGSAAATAATTFRPVADARVEEAAATSSYGTATRLGSDGDTSARIESILRFNVSGLAGTVRSAKLRLYVVSDPTVDGPAVYPTGSSWSETGVTWATRPAATGPAVADMGAGATGTWVELDVTPLVRGDGTVSLLLRQPGTDGVIFYAREKPGYEPQLVVTTDSGGTPTPTPTPTPSPSPSPSPTPTPAPAGDPVIAAAGDIAGAPTDGEATAKLLDQIDPTRVLALGDEAYPDGSASDFATNYDPSWGRHKFRTSPTPGNHEYHTSGASGYFGYYGARAPAPYYSYDVGSWHLISLNSEIASSAGSAQEGWLKSDLAAHPSSCVLAYWHQPRFSSGPHGNQTAVSALWSDLYAAGADVVLNGHDHDYERFAPQDPSGRADAAGIREFVVGTGGAERYAESSPQPNSELWNGDTFGVLKLTLHDGSYDWRFVPVAGSTFTDSGSATCSGTPQDGGSPTPTPTPTTTPSPTPTPTGAAPPYRYMYNSGPAQDTVAANGYNLLDVGGKWAADHLPAGAKGLVWVGDYDNSTCSWELSDSSLSSKVSSMVGDAKVAGYFFSDEPDPYACPNAPAQHRERSKLIRSLDPGKFTVMVMDANSGRQSLDQVPLWTGAADHVGLDPYPCRYGGACDYAWIDAIIGAADRAGLDYWGVVQAFDDGSSWRWPTTDELNHMLGQWDASRQTGIMTFAWTWAGRTLSDKPDLLSALKSYNTR
jgi:Calcineurin-like phosphoesterase